MKVFLKKKRAEAPNTLAHLYLNPKDSSWANFGYWKNTTDYPTACKELALLLGKKADLKPGLKTLDLGFGCGDQFFVWKEEFSLDFSDIVGVNGSLVQTEFAKNLIESKSDVSPQLICSSVEKALLSFPHQSLDRILCLDSASFFSNRIEFCKQSFEILKPGGKLVSAELILKNSKLGIIDSWLRKMICKSGSIPKNNQVTPDFLSQLLRSSGFLLEGFDFLEEYIFEDFSNFLKMKSKEPSIPREISRKYFRFAEFLGGERMKKYFQFVLYSAVKPS
ncbi:class I SAM-dependent methyltransferase [Leptospira noguchii]|uniref:class I SAM-dependent methyltransferase n=1 Tax=Leptospira noguchii TaxID=28182 RepID=UPI0007733420|nr:class I SAM-dependent methyltransferase [Leptospira noguchii]